MANENINCECGKTFEEKEFMKHFKNCEKLINKYKDFDCKIANCLKAYIKNKDNLIIIKFLFKRFISLLEHKLNDSFSNLNHFNLNNIYTNKNNNKNSINTIIEKNPLNCKFISTITNKLSNKYCNTYRACIFSSKRDNNVYIAYGTLSCDLECFDVINNKKFILIKNLYEEPFHSCRYFYDEQNKKDLIITSYSTDNQVKFVKFEKGRGEFVYNLDFRGKPEIRTTYLINELLIILFYNEVYIFNLYLKKYNKLQLKYNNFFCINNYLCKKNKMNLLLLSNDKGTIIYEVNSIYIEKIRLYKEFFIEDKRGGYIEAFMFEKENNIFLVEAILDTISGNNLYIWNLESQLLIDKINVGITLTDINIWKDDFFFASLCDEEDYGFLLFNIKKKKIEKKFILNDKTQRIYGIKVLTNSEKGDYLITLSFFGKLDLYKIG